MLKLSRFYGCYLLFYFYGRSGAGAVSLYGKILLLIEVMFSLNGLGLLGYEATVSRDYPVMFGTLYIFTLIGLLLNIVSDISYTLVDPRIDFEGR